jgi:hypothetical protein
MCYGTWDRGSNRRLERTAQYLISLQKIELYVYNKTMYGNTLMSMKLSRREYQWKILC